MLKGQVLRVVGQTSRGIDANLSRLEKFEVFCQVCDGLLKDGRIIQGITEVRGNPSIVLSQGGISQMIPQSRVKSSKGLKQSLMLSADQLALTAQDVADLVAFMKQWQ